MTAPAISSKPSGAQLTRWGELLQIAYVTKAFDEALDYWTGLMGAGPFFVRRNLMLENWRYRGQPVDINIDVGIGYWGEVQIELIKQNCQTASVYREWQAAGRADVHHLGLRCTDGPATRAALDVAGLEILQDVDGPTGGMFYAGRPTHDQTFLEFICPTERQRTYFEMMREAHRGWDGVTDPIR